MPDRDTSGNQLTEDLTISTVSELDLVEDKYSGRKPLGLWADTWRRLKRNHLAVVGLCIIVVFLAVGMTQEIANLVGLNTGEPGTGYLAPYPPNAVNYELSPQGSRLATLLVPPVRHRLPGPRRLLADAGRDAHLDARRRHRRLDRADHRSHPRGRSGLYGGAVDSVIMRTADVFFAFPYILFVLLIMTVLGPGLWNAFIAIGILSGPPTHASTAARC